MRDPRHLTFHFIALSCAIVFAGMHWFISSDRFVICYVLSAPIDSVTKVYWDVGDGFTERQSVGRWVTGATDTPVCFADPRLRDLARVRIDPTDQPGPVRLSQVVLRYLDLLGPWPARDAELRTTGAQRNNQISKIGTGKAFTATGGDPYFVWVLPGRVVGAKVGLVINVLSVYAVVLVVLYVLARLPASGEVKATTSALNGLWLLALYPLFVLFCILTVQYVDLARFSHLAIYVCIALYSAFAFLGQLRSTYTAVPRYVTAVLAVLCVVSFDIAYRFGFSAKPVFTRFANDPYHWRITRTAADNISHSSIRYYPDFRNIQGIVVGKSLFLADVATSYYVAAALPLYAANTHGHHGRDYDMYREILRALCGESNKNSIDDAEKLLRGQREQSIKAGRLPVRYIFVNKDTVNKNVKGHCMTRNHNEIERQLERFFKQIYTGQYIDVFEITDSVNSTIKSY